MLYMLINNIQNEKELVVEGNDMVSLKGWVERMIDTVEPLIDVGMVDCTTLII
jgi:hypothetical protein